MSKGTIQLVAGLAIAALPFWLLTFCFDYCLMAIFGKDLPWYIDLIGGIVLSGVIVATTVIIWIVQMCGIATPFVS